MNITRNIPFLIQNLEGKEIFSIEDDGSINWILNGELVKAKTDHELGLSLAQALNELVKNNLT